MHLLDLSYETFEAGHSTAWWGDALCMFYPPCFGSSEECPAATRVRCGDECLGLSHGLHTAAFNASTAGVVLVMALQSSLDVSTLEASWAKPASGVPVQYFNDQRDREKATRLAEQSLRGCLRQTELLSFLLLSPSPTANHEVTMRHVSVQTGTSPTR